MSQGTRRRPADSSSAGGTGIPRGRKRHLITDTLGLVLTVLVTATSVRDSAGGKQTLTELAAAHPSVAKVWADGRLPDQRRPARRPPFTCTPTLRNRARHRHPVQLRRRLLLLRLPARNRRTVCRRPHRVLGPVLHRWRGPRPPPRRRAYGDLAPLVDGAALTLPRRTPSRN
ncbi:transposase [Streptomyces sp. NPDC051079]|uniref:transposase n=1 Tax=Streptomyces sp. NPDC051079 TaxID=3155043 RepID=UPI00344FB82A